MPDAPWIGINFCLAYMWNLKNSETFDNLSNFYYSDGADSIPFFKIPSGLVTTEKMLVIMETIIFQGALNEG